jgi:hypothetical protein
MSVYVDDLNRPARVGRISSRWSHLFADTHAELEDFARKLGLRPDWIQHAGTHREHYDLTASKRAQALQLGAQPISYLRDVPQLIASRRHAIEQQTVVSPHPLRDALMRRPGPRRPPHLEGPIWTQASRAGARLRA